MATRLGSCSICGGEVMAVDSWEWFSTEPLPPPTCRSCGAVTAASQRDVIPMVPVPAVGPLPGLLSPPQPAQPWPPAVNWPDSITRWSLRNIDNLFREGGECFVLGGRDQPLKVTIR